MREVLAKSILSAKNHMNVYRGCTHGCIYCDSRSECYGMTYTFEDVEAKVNAPELLEQALRKKRQPCVITTGAMCDPYLPLEKELGLTRACLEVIARYGFGAAVLTKSDLVLRDVDLLRRIHEQTKCVVQMTLTTHDDALCRILEPHVAPTSRRVEVLHALRRHGIPTVVWLTPTLPFLTDTEENVRGLLQSCAQAGVHGVLTFGMGMTLRSGNREYFYAQLDKHFPGLKQQYIHQYGLSYGIPSPNGKALGKLVKDFCREHDMLCGTRAVFSYVTAWEDPGQSQLSLFP